MSKTQYFKHDFKLSENQIQTVVAAIKSTEPIVLKLTKKTYTNGNFPLPLTKSDANNVIKKKDLIMI